LRDGMDALPVADAAVRARLDAEAAESGVPALHARLALLDPITAARLKPKDSQRIQRALEIIELTGQPMSSLLTGDSGGKPAPYSLLPLALEPSDRSVLHERIAQRFDQMLEGDALLDEVTSLRARGDLHPGLPSMRCVGYRQAWEYLDGLIDRSALREKGIAATRQLAKRQLTWLRGMDERIVIDCLAKDATQQVLERVRIALEQRPAG
jgi:tRNA dimethylallyltransferase